MNYSEEVWKPVPRYKGILEASNLGRIKILSGNYCYKDRILKGSITKDNFIKFTIKIDAKAYYEFAHVLVAETFYTPYEYLDFVTHLDKNRLNNKINNLKWIPKEETFINNSKIIKQYDLNGNFIQEFESIKNASNKLGMYYPYLARCIRNNKSYKGFKFKVIE